MKNALRIGSTFLLAAVMGSAMAQSQGLVDLKSAHKVDETVSRIESAAKSRGLTIFSVIDHSGAASKAGMDLRNTKLIILGNPKGGTPLMAKSARSAIDLPLKVLVWEKAPGETIVTINDAGWFGARHGIDAEMLKPIAGLPGLIEAALK